MAFDSTRHTIDERTGFHTDPATGGVLGQFQAPVKESLDKGSEYPKWVKPDDSYVVEVNGHKLTPLWPDFAVNRDTKEVMVLVHDAVEEATVTSPKDSASTDTPIFHHPV